MNPVWSELCPQQLPPAEWTGEGHWGGPAGSWQQRLSPRVPPTVAPPRHFCKVEDALNKRLAHTSKHALKNYVQRPHTYTEARESRKRGSNTGSYLRKMVNLSPLASKSVVTSNILCKTAKTVLRRMKLNFTDQKS